MGIHVKILSKSRSYRILLLAHRDKLLLVGALYSIYGRCQKLCAIYVHLKGDLWACFDLIFDLLRTTMILNISLNREFSGLS